MKTSETGSLVVELSLAFPVALVLLLGLALVIRDGAARTEVQELAFAAADVAVAANDATSAQLAAQQLLQSDRDARNTCLDPLVRLRDPASFRPAGTVDVEVRCDVPIAGGRVQTYTATAKRRIDPYRQVGQS